MSGIPGWSTRMLDFSVIISYRRRIIIYRVASRLDSSDGRRAHRICLVPQSSLEWFGFRPHLVSCFLRGSTEQNRSPPIFFACILLLRLQRKIVGAASTDTMNRLISFRFVLECCFGAGRTASFILFVGPDRITELRLSIEKSFIEIVFAGGRRHIHRWKGHVFYIFTDGDSLLFGDLS